jgi:hypothetical protein
VKGTEKSTGIREAKLGDAGETAVAVAVAVAAKAQSGPISFGVQNIIFLTPHF